ncbi:MULTISPECIES: LAGLIDADG family homing endonuclease [Vibrio]|uniref:LAGLIDADG family homing endonuclease n=1 Tax=Vibrio TaxID=662 RepID=UPI002075556C|nr:MULTISPECIES: LAGLIDADG family homing endonuclease [Vibrio]USD53376.1 hypothetical protein J4N44_08475 [Vibrio sp. SCSIO 43155]HDM8053477.1 hypothetical protein [Vibrio harveyi]
MSEIIDIIVKRYINQCEQNVSMADVKTLCDEYSYNELGYASLDSMKSAVSKKLGKIGFNKKRYTKSLIKDAYARIDDVDVLSKDHIISVIQSDLAQHELKYKTVRDLLQEMNLSVRQHHTNTSFEQFKNVIAQGHSYIYAVNESDLSAHREKRAKSWFIDTHNGDERETRKTRRKDRLHQYLNLKDYILLSSDEASLSRIWTTIGFTFADGSISDGSTVLVITQTDGFYLSDYCIPSLLNHSIEGNVGPKLIIAHSDHNDTAYENSKPVARAHLEDSYLAAFLSELGIPENKEQDVIQLSDKILSLPDKYFFSYLAGLFAGDGCITRGGKGRLHLSFDLHCEQFCNDVKTQIKSRLGIPMKVYSHKTKNNKEHFKVSATTTWRALSLLFVMYYYAPFHLERKTQKGDQLIREVIDNVPSYSMLTLTLSGLESGQYSLDELNNQLVFLRRMAASKTEK